MEMGGGRSYFHSDNGVKLVHDVRQFGYLRGTAIVRRQNKH